MSSPGPLALVLLASLAVLAACGSASPGAAPVPAEGVVLPAGLDTRVTEVVDGDTVTVEGGHRVRLIGIDTPETRDPRVGVECFGREASQALSRMLPAGSAVRLVGDVEQTDAFGRTLAYLYRLSDGLFVNAAMVEEGYARTLTIAPNVAHAADLATLAGDARRDGRGLWAACPGVP